MMFDALRAPRALAALLVVGLAALEAERRWTRARRRQLASPGALAYLLDALALGAGLGCLASAALLATSAVQTGASRLGATIPAGGQWAIDALVVACATLVAGALLKRRGAGSGRPLPESGRSDANSAAPPSAGGIASEAMSPVQPDDAAFAAADELSSEYFLGVSMMRKRPPAAPVVHPESFLSLREPAPPPPKRRSGRWPALATLVVIGGLAFSAFWYRQPLEDLIARAVAGQRAAATGAPIADTAPRQLLAAPDPVTRRVKSDALNLRAGPGADQPVLAVLARGDTVTLLEGRQIAQNLEWVRVRAGEHEGWVSAKLLE